MRSHDDRTVLRLAAEGHADARQELAQRLLCVPRFLAALNSRLNFGFSAEELEDLTQDVLTIIWSKREEFTGECALSTWSHGICRLELMNAARRKRRDAAGTIELQLEPECPRTEPASRAQAVADAMERLDAETAAVLRWKHFAGLTFRQIAEETGRSPSAVKRRYYGGLEELRRKLGSKEASCG